VPQVGLRGPAAGGARILKEVPIREVQMTPDLAEAVVEHLDRLRRMGAPTPHTPRRTYISIELQANEFDVKWS